MKILFLDIDGVLLIHNSYNIPEKKMYLLEKIVKETNCKIVIHSSMREEGIELLRKHGFKYVDNIIGVVPFLGIIKGKQILHYLKENNVSNYVVVDDEHKHICSPKHNYISKSNFVYVDRNIGLSKENTEEIIKKMNK